MFNQFKTNMRKVILLFSLICVCVGASFGQSRMLTGTVTSTSGEPLEAANVTVAETQKGTLTDSRGKFQIRASVGQTLRISYIGAKPFTWKVDAATANVNIKLEIGSTALNDVVVTGYQAQRKADITGAVSVVNTKDIASIPTGNVTSALQGRLPGLTVFNDGTPGGVGTSTAIRGLTSLGNNTPLYVVDGVQTRDNIATLLNSNDVESIQVLKDAASASIYGVQAANGVIIITTKKAKKNEVRINFDSNHSLQQFHTGIDMLNTQQWGESYWTAYQNDGVKPHHDLYGSGDVPVIPEYIDAKKTIRSANTNWAKEVYHNALLQNYNLSVSKGSDNGSSTFSFNYFDQDGLIKYTNFTRFNGRSNSDYSFLKNRIRVGENLNISKWNEKLKPAGIEELTIAQHPIIPVYDINGGYAGPTQGIGDKPNPIRLLDQQRQNRSEQWRIFGNAYLELEPLKNLVFRSNFSINYRNGFSSNFEPKWKEGDRTVDKNMLTVNSDYDRQWIWTNSVSYQYIRQKHSVNLFAGTESKEQLNENLTGYRENFLIEALDYRYLNAGDGKQTNGNGASRYAISSYFGRFNYAYSGKYLLQGTLRRDASSRFGSNNNEAFFPSVSAGWRISEESFLKNVDFISDLKLRASWGKNGNDQIDNEATYTKYRTDLIRAGYDLGGINQGTIPNGIIKERTGNPNIKWESTAQTDFGFDLSALKNRLNFTFDYFIKNTSNLLFDRPYIGIIGEGGYMAYNGVSLSNKGVEGIVNWQDKIGRDFSYSLTLAGSGYKNRVTEVPEDIYYTYGGGNGINLSIVGQPAGSWLGYKTNGLYRTTEELNDGINQPGKGLGRIRYVDVNDDKVIDDKDRVWLGSDQPKFTGGLNVAVSYKAFDFAFFLNGMIRDAYNNAKFYTDFFQLWTGNHGTRLLDAWNPTTNYDSSIPALTAVNLNDEGRLSDYFIENGSYLKLKNIQLGYTLPSSVAGRLNIKNLRVYLQGQDLFTITKYKGADPEGLGYPYPLPRIYTVGLNVGF
ncbi:TonB-dependent receptor [Arcticibacter tournemirensis]|uniref:TonB-dependent receptor n=2 Tax=Arcticibacter tournemirensis TaxID=699437 RepID=A0A4Q0MB83_9SPHI|nr:TonB-dependent receptor [Arcticibacter tournemirensis]